MNIEPIILILTGITSLIIQMAYFLLDDRSLNSAAEDRRLKLIGHAAAGCIHIWIAFTVGRITHDWH